jgi:hypothetical protein
VTETIRPSSTVTCSKDETEDLVSLRGVRLLIPEPSKVGKRGRRLPSVGEDWRLKCREFGLQHALMGFVLLAGEVAYEV